MQAFQYAESVSQGSRSRSKRSKCNETADRPPVMCLILNTMFVTLKFKILSGGIRQNPHLQLPQTTCGGMKLQQVLDLKDSVG